MIQPATHTLTIHPGAVFQRTLNASAAGAPLSLAAYAPFRMEIRKTPGGTLLGTVTVDSSDAADGTLVLSMTAEETDALAEGQANHDLIDTHGNPWITGPVKIRRTITDPIP